jgi:hypothetical protein
MPMMCWPGVADNVLCDRCLCEEMFIVSASIRGHTECGRLELLIMITKYVGMGLLLPLLRSDSFFATNRTLIRRYEPG